MKPPQLEVGLVKITNSLMK